MLSDYETGLYAGYAPCFTGAQSQGRIPDELNKNLQKVIALLLEEENVTKLLRIQAKNNVGKNVGIDNMLHILFQ